MKLSKEVKLGLYAIGAIVTLIWGLNFLKGRNIFSSQRTFYAVYHNIDGLMAANPVQINGFKVGQVKSISLFPDTTGRLLVTLYISDRNLRIPRNSIARIVSADFLGSKAVHIKYGNTEKMAESGDTLISDIEEDFKSVVDRRIAPLQKKAEGLISSIDSVMTVIQVVFNKDARENLSKSFNSITRAIENFERTSLRLDTLIHTEKGKLSVIFGKVESITSNIAANNDKLSSIVKNWSNISDSVAKSNVRQTIMNANEALTQTAKVMEKINKGEGTIGMLVNDKKLYGRLDSASAALDNLIRDLNENPKKYVHFSVFGKKDKKKKGK